MMTGSQIILMKRMIMAEATKIKIGHALGACREMQRIADEFRALARTTPVPTPAMDRLAEYLDPNVEPMADGRAGMPVNWTGVWIGLGIIAVLVLILVLYLQ